MSTRLNVCLFALNLLLSTAVKSQQTFCNPLNISYRFALDKPSRRSAADPVIVLYKDKYYLFATSSGGYWFSNDLLRWNFMTTRDLPFEKDAPAVAVVNGSLYYMPLNSHIIYKTNDPVSGKWEKYNDHFPLAIGDPDFFQDTDGKVYLYFGCTNNDYLYAVELDVNNKLNPIGEPVDVLKGNPAIHGWERPGDYNTQTDNPWTEAPWVNKHNGKYYYQYSAPGTQYKSYADGYYISDKPLGPFTYESSSPFSAKPEGFIDGAGHSATFADKYGNYWHISSLSISVKHIFERRLGLFPVTFDQEGHMIAHTEFGDYPVIMPHHKIKDVSELFPGWMLLSYKKSAEASSSLEGHPATLAFDENVRDYWSAKTGDKGEWLSVDLGSMSTVKAVQLNFAENNTQLFGRQGILAQQYLLEYSTDNKTWKMLVDKRTNEQDLTHQYHAFNTPVKARYLKVTNYRVPGGTFAISGFRVFGIGTGKAPAEVGSLVVRRDESDARNVTLSWKKGANALGYNVRFGVEKNHLNRVYQVYEDTVVTIRSLNKDQPYWFALDAFGENGVATMRHAVQAEKAIVDYVNPLLGTATLWDSADIGFKPTHRTWGAEVFPGSSLPNAMVQLTPVTRYHSGSGYQYEDTVIYGFAHTSKGHWNLCNIPILPVTGTVSADDYCSGYSHSNESAHPGYYQVYLQRYGINAELTSTLRCAYHKYTFGAGKEQKLLVDLPMSNERVRSWDIARQGQYVFTGFQQAGEKIYFYAIANHAIQRIDSLQRADSLQKGERIIPVVHFSSDPEPLEIRIGFSFVSVQNARANLEKEIGERSFAETRAAATRTWQQLLSKITVSDGTDRQRQIFYSCLYRSFLWPALRSDINGDFTDASGKVVNKGFNYYTEPSLWDDYRNKLVLLGILSPDVTVDVIRSLIDKGEKTGFMPTFFHGDHAAPFIAGSWLRGLRGFDVDSAYHLLLRNATIEGGPRPYITEYNDKGYISTPDIANPVVETKAKAGVTKTLEYAYDDYAVALLAKALGDTANYRMLMKRTGNFKNVFDPATRFMRGRLADGKWVGHFDPEYPYYEYMYREANAWQSSFFAPQDVPGLVRLYGGRRALEQKLDSLFAIPWDGVEAYNISGFIGQYCQGNQPDHSVPFMYYFAGKQEKAQVILDSILHHFYGMGKEGLAYAGMDDAGEMSSWYVFNAMGFYPFSPADPRYIVSVPLFSRIEIASGDKKTFTILKTGNGKKIVDIKMGHQNIDGYFITDKAIKDGDHMVIRTR
jgi:predicted alpha-1,2-mannosidase